MELSHNLKLYIKLYKLIDETVDIDKQDELSERMEELYYELSDEDISYLEEKQII